MSKLKSKRSARRVEPVYPIDDTLVAYARVSTEDQSFDMQIEDFLRAGVDPDAIYKEAVSGVAKRRPQLELAIKRCRPGMTLVVWKLDRAGRSLFDLLTLVKRLETAEIGFRSLREKLDTTSPTGRVMFAMLGAFAQFERDIIAERTKAGVALAISRGIKFGQPTKIPPAREKEIEKLVADGWSVKQIAKHYKLSPSTVRLKFSGERLQKIRRRAKRQRK